MNEKHAKHVRLGFNFKKHYFQLCVCVHVFAVARENVGSPLMRVVVLEV